MNKCSGQEPLPPRRTATGWPYGRRECPVCHGFYTLTKSGRLYKHTPNQGDNPYQAEQRARLN